MWCVLGDASADDADDDENNPGWDCIGLITSPLLELWERDVGSAVGVVVVSAGSIIIRD